MRIHAVPVSLLVAFCGAMANALPPIMNGLVAAYPFDGDADDVSGNGNHGVVNGATPTTDRFGNVGSAYLFDGLNDTIDSAGIFSPQNEGTLSLWFNMNGSEPTNSIISSRSDNGYLDGDFFLSPDQTTNAPSVTYWSGSGVWYGVASPTPLSSEGWHHIAWSWSTSGISRLYVDNVVTDGTVVPVPIFGNVPLAIGRAGHIHFGSPNYDYFSGSIDDVYIYDRALSEAEVSALFTGTPLPDTDDDGVPDATDNCLEIPNGDQADANSSEDDNTALTGIQHYGDLCDGDINNDGAVDGFDFSAYFLPCFIKGFVSTYPECATSDFDGDGAVTGADFTETFLPQFSKGTPGP